MNENLNLDLLKQDVEQEIISPMPTDALLLEYGCQLFWEFASRNQVETMIQ